jgi:hypothetical protein
LCVQAEIVVALYKGIVKVMKAEADAAEVSEFQFELRLLAPGPLKAGK